MNMTPAYQYKGKEILFSTEIAIFSWFRTDQKITKKENTCVPPVASSHPGHARFKTNQALRIINFRASF